MVRYRRLGVILGTYFGIVAGAGVYSWSPLTIVVLFTCDALFGYSRIQFERLAAGRPRGNGTPHFGTHGELESFYRLVLNKRGAICVADWLPKLYPRNIPFVLQHLSVLGVAGMAIAVALYYGMRPAGSIDHSVIIVLPFIFLKHAIIVRIWTADGVYDQASVSTVRPHEVLYTVLVTGVAIFIVGIQPDATGHVVEASIYAIVVKLPFDHREAGIGPRWLTFDPSSETTDEPLALPAGTPQHVFETDTRAIRRAAVLDTVLHTISMGLFVVGIYGLIVVWLLELSTLSFVAILVIWITSSFVLAFVVTYPVFWLGPMHAEYRLYENALVAYDRYLNEPQWRLPVSEIQTVTVNESSLDSRFLPHYPTPVYIEQSARMERKLQYLERPHEFQRVIRQQMDGQSTSTRVGPKAHSDDPTFP